MIPDANGDGRHAIPGPGHSLGRCAGVRRVHPVSVTVGKSLRRWLSGPRVATLSPSRRLRTSWGCIADDHLRSVLGSTIYDSRRATAALGSAPHLADGVAGDVRRSAPNSSCVLTVLP